MDAKKAFLKGMLSLANLKRLPSTVSEKGGHFGLPKHYKQLKHLSVKCKKARNGNRRSSSLS